jgi:hypothetical protein
VDRQQNIYSGTPSFPFVLDKQTFTLPVMMITCTLTNQNYIVNLVHEICKMNAYVHLSACSVSLNDGLGFDQILYCGVDTDIS